MAFIHVEPPAVRTVLYFLSLVANVEDFYALFFVFVAI